jgi:hypothetical protein
MANLQIKGIDEKLYDQIKRLAASEHRSISQQVLFLVKSYIARKSSVQNIKTPAQILLDLSGSWEDEKPAEIIIGEIKKARKQSKKCRQGF